MKNLSKAYYKDYFKSTKFEIEQKGTTLEITANSQNIKENNRNILGTASSNRKYIEEARQIFASGQDLISHSFLMEVRYPGLLTGAGITHEARIEGEFKLGIHLDYTTGLPVIYGSSVKGVLRSAFQTDNLLEVLTTLVPERARELKEIGDKLQKKPMKYWCDSLFGDDDDRDKRSIYHRDVFFDAIIEAPNEKGQMLASDSITPHGDNPLKNPIPLTFVRIASGCKIRFRFKLTDSDDLKADEKCMLFQAILKTFGIGAKTNVGYGRLR